MWWSFLGDSPCLLTDAFTSFSCDDSGYEDYGCGGYGGKSQGKSKRTGNRHGTWFAQSVSPHSLPTLRACSRMLSRPFQVMTQAMMSTATAVTEARAGERARTQATDTALGLRILSAVFCVWWSFLGDSPCLLTDAFTSFSSDDSGYEDYGCGGYGGKSQGKNKRTGNRHGTWSAHFVSGVSGVVVIPWRLSALAHRCFHVLFK